MTTSVVATTLSVVLLPQVLLLLCTAQGRKNAYIAVETVLASVLVVLLLAIVLGLPIGAPLLAASPARALRARRALDCICSLHACVLRIYCCRSASSFQALSTQQRMGDVRFMACGEALPCTAAPARCAP